jgi:nucleoside-diphosphate-sugar epimerase
MRVFITGASGYVGQAVVQGLVAEGHDVEALVREGADASVVSDIGAEPRRGHLGELDLLRAAGDRADAVIHLAPSDPDMDLAASTALQKRLGDGPFVFTGGAWVYGDTDGVVDEDAPLAPPPIVAWRVANTRAIMSAADQGGRPVLIMPGAVYGDNAGIITAAMIGPARSQGYASYVADGRNHMALVHRRDLARLYVLALGAPAGSRYLGVGESDVTMRHVAEAASRAAGAGGATRSLSLDEAQQVWGPLADALALDQQFTARHAREDLGWVSREAGILEYLADSAVTAAVARP